MTAMGNSYIERRERERQNVFEAGMEIGFQKAIDFMCMALNDPECMGPKGVIGGEKIEKIATFACDLDHIYQKAFTPRDPEADVWQERLDAKQRRIFKEKSQPFRVRYPWVRDVVYKK